MARQHRSRKSNLKHIAHQAARQLEFSGVNRSINDSIVRPPIKVKTIQAVRWTRRTPNLDRPFKRNTQARPKSKHAYRTSTHPRIDLIA